MNATRRGMSLVELQIVCVIIGVLSAILIPEVLHYTTREKRQSVACLRQLVAAVGGGKSATCPVTGRPLWGPGAAAPTVASCPDPAKHLQPEIIVRRQAGVTSLIQNLPAAPPSGELRQGDRRLTLEETNGSATLRLVPDRWWRWIWYPFAGFFLAGLAAGALFSFGPKYFRREPEPVVAKLSVAGILWVLATLLLFPAETVLVVVPSQVRIETRVLGMPWGVPRISSDVIGIVAVKSQQHFAVVALVNGGGACRGEDLVTVGSDQLALVSRLQKALGK